MTRTELPSPTGLHRRQARTLQGKLAQVLALEEEMRSLLDAELPAEVASIRSQLPTATPSQRAALQVRAFALTREAAHRVLGQLAYPVQVLGGLAVADGILAEMATGEGKTLTSTMPVVWFALSGRGVHVATANPYLATRDAANMGRVYAALGLTTGKSLPGMSVPDRQAAYACDVTYSTAQQLGFDHLGDNMVDSSAKKVQRSLYAAVVDEADALLIDEARTPLVISSPDPSPGADWAKISELVASLPAELYELDRSEEAVHLTEAGVAAVEAALEVENLYDHPTLVHRIHTSLKAHTLFERDKDYLVTSTPGGAPSVVIVDAQTGRLMPSRRFQDSIHEALEAKEGLPVKRPSRTVAAITLQSYFGMYEHLGGMTGTAANDADELTRTYGTPVAQIPTHRPRARQDLPDLIYATFADKEEAVVEEIRTRQAAGQPVLVGTLSVEESDRYSQLLEEGGVEHVVLNARNHFTEAAAIAQAGRRGAVTISTNMAGRGVDIQLGGDPEALTRSELEAADLSPEERSLRWDASLAHWQSVCEEERADVLAAGGLYVLATGRNPSRRIDDQLRGRSGRQGEPGATRFYISCEDDLVALFGGQNVAGIVDRLASAPGEPVTSRILSKMVSRAQARIEGIHAQQRRTLLDYDKVVAAQRQAVYRWRDRILATPFEQLARWWFQRTYSTLLRSAGLGGPEVERTTVEQALKSAFPGDLPPAFSDLSTLGLAEATSALVEVALSELRTRFAQVPDEAAAGLLRHVLLQFVDDCWAEQLASLDLAQEGIFLYQVGQQDPRTAYTEAARDLFVDMVETAFLRGTRILWQLEISLNDPSEEIPSEEPVGAPVESPVSP